MGPSGLPPQPDAHGLQVKDLSTQLIREESIGGCSEVCRALLRYSGSRKNGLPSGQVMVMEKKQARRGITSLPRESETATPQTDANLNGRGSLLVH